MSTELAIFDLLFQSLPAIENKNYALCLFLDYSACFDTIDRNILIEKLDKYGVRGLDKALLENYFKDRRQLVKFQEENSYVLRQNIGVIQGSRLGPLLFDVYSNDFSKLGSNQENILYADDACIIYSDNSLQNLINLANEKIQIINEWCNGNKLFLNRKKCEFMIITNKTIDITP